MAFSTTVVEHFPRNAKPAFSRSTQVLTSGGGGPKLTNNTSTDAVTEDGSVPRLGDRAQHLLKVLIQQYIRDGQPVGSRTLSKGAGLSLSAASVRNVMADLEELGFISSPHTSAGRVPTAQGYRMFVDSLLTVRGLDIKEIERIEKELGHEVEPTSIMEAASQLLSEFTNFAGLITLPTSGHATLRQVEFLSLSEDQVLVILVVNQQEVQNRIIRTDRIYSAAELVQAANYLNASYAGLNLNSVRRRLLKELEKDRANLTDMMKTVVAVAGRALVPAGRQEGLLVSGQTNLMEHGELADMERLRQLFNAFSQKRDILHLLDQSQVADGVKLFIGEESGYEMLDACTVVTSAYEVEGQTVGVLGIVGPTRMAYERVIPLVDVTAKVVSAALNQRH